MAGGIFLASAGGWRSVVAERWAVAAKDRWIGAGVGILALAVYLRGLLPGVGYSGDAAKWQTISQVGGVPHATGYPLYVGLIQAFRVIVPFGSAAWTTNVFSAVCGAATAAVLYLLLRILGVGAPAAASAAVTFALTHVFWTNAEIAEVYTLHLLLMAAVFYCLARWHLGGPNGWLLASVGVLGLSLGHHLTMMWAVPGVAWVVWTGRRRAVTKANALWAGLAALLGASQYLYLLRMTDVGGYVESPVHDLGDVWAVATGGDFKDAMFAFSPAELLTDRVPMLLDYLRDQYLILLIPVAFGLWQGLVRLDRPKRDVTTGLAIFGLSSAVYALNYDVLDVIVFFLPLFMVLAVFLGFGLDAATRRIPLPPLAAAAALIAIPVVTGIVNYPRASQRGNAVVAARIEETIAVVGDRAIVVTDTYDDTEYYLYYLLGEHRGAGRDIVVLHEVTPRQVKELVGAPSSGTTPAPVYTSSSKQAQVLLDKGLTVTPVGGHVWRIEPSTVLAPETRVRPRVSGARTVNR